ADHIDRDVAIEPGVASEKDPTILRAAELAQDLVLIVELAEIWSELRVIRHAKYPAVGIPAGSCGNYADQFIAFRSAAPRERKSASHMDLRQRHGPGQGSAAGSAW